MPAKLAKADITPVPGVYRIWLSDRHYYIGRSSDIEGRCSGHLKMLRKQTHPNPRMQAAFNKHGGFRYEVVEVLSPEQAKVLEQSLIDEHLGQPSCLNICPSSEIPTRKGLRNTPEHNAKISSAKLGVSLSPDARQNISSAQKQRFANGWSDGLREAMMKVRDTPEYRQKLSKALKGKVLSEGTRAKLSLAGKGRVKSEVTRKRLSESHKGKEKTPEWIAKIAAANRGRKASEETRAKMRLAQAKRQERERLARQEVFP